MFEIKKSKNWLCRIHHEWSYLLYSGAAAFLAALKAFVYSHAFSPENYALISYYLFILGIGILIAGSGVMLRCHSELPELALKRDKLNKFLAEVRGVSLLAWVVFVACLFTYGMFLELPAAFLLLTSLQVLLILLFTVDLLVVKSRKNFSRYAKTLFFRNIIIFAAGALVAFLTSSVLLTIISEVVSCLVICSRSIGRWAKGIAIPNKKFLLACLGFVPITLLGALLQFIERFLATIVLNKEEFSIFSYYFLIVMIGFSLQQFINTKVFTIISIKASSNARLAFNYLLKVSFFSALLSTVIFVIIFYAITSRHLSPEWLKIDFKLGVVFLVIAIIKCCDFSYSLLVVLKKKKMAFFCQIVSVAVYVSLLTLYKFLWVSSGLYGFVLVLLVGAVFSITSSNFLAWRASREKALY